MNAAAIQQNYSIIAVTIIELEEEGMRKTDASTHFIPKFHKKRPIKKKSSIASFKTSKSK